jgi:hypothetical protein
MVRRPLSPTGSSIAGPRVRDKMAYRCLARPRATYWFRHSACSRGALTSADPEAVTGSGPGANSGARRLPCGAATPSREPLFRSRPLPHRRGSLLGPHVSASASGYRVAGIHRTHAFRRRDVTLAGGPLDRSGSVGGAFLLHPPRPHHPDRDERHPDQPAPAGAAGPPLGSLPAVRRTMRSTVCGVVPVDGV